jgi:Domain of unknown function (DUF1990)
MLPRRFTTSLRWPVGVLVTGWAYMWRTTPLHRREHAGAWEEDRPRPLPPEHDDDGVQHVGEGEGPLLHRRYRARIRDGELDAAGLIARLAADPNRVTPGTMSHFEQRSGAPSGMAPGDEWLVHMPGPWDGPVRVVEVTPTSFRFATLRGHLEAGQIEWRAEDDGDDVVFGVESWARTGDRLSDLMHNRLRMAKEVQLHMWTSVIEQAAELAGGRLARGIDIDTRRVEMG